MLVSSATPFALGFFQSLDRAGNLSTFCAWPASTPQQGLLETEAVRHGIIELTIAA